MAFLWGRRLAELIRHAVPFPEHFQSRGAGMVMVAFLAHWSISRGMQLFLDTVVVVVRGLVIRGAGACHGVILPPQSSCFLTKI